MALAWQRRWTWNGVWQAALLITIVTRAVGRLIPDGVMVEILTAQAAVWFVGSWLAAHSQSRSSRIWHAFCFSVVVQNVLIAVVNLQATVTVLVVSSTTLVISAIFGPLQLLASGAISVRLRVRIVVVILAALVVVGAVYERWST